MTVLQAYSYLREEVKEFLGKPIHVSYSLYNSFVLLCIQPLQARIKTITLQQRNTYPTENGRPVTTTTHTQRQQSLFPFPPPTPVSAVLMGLPVLGLSCAVEPIHCKNQLVETTQIFGLFYL